MLYTSRDSGRSEAIFLAILPIGLFSGTDELAPNVYTHTAERGGGT